MTLPDDDNPPETQNLPIDPKIDGLIGEKLRKYYDTLMNEPIPNRILELLRQLEEKENSRQPDRGSE